MSKLHIKKDDTVIVIAGADKGKTGKVLKVLVDENRAIVEGVHMVSKSMKPSAKNPQGGIVKQEAPIHISNLSLIDPKSGKATRVAIKHEGKNVVRIAKKSGKGDKKVKSGFQPRIRQRWQRSKDCSESTRVLWISSCPEGYIL